MSNNTQLNPDLVNGDPAHFVTYRLERAGTLRQTGKINSDQLALYAMLAGFAYRQKDGQCRSNNGWLAWRMGKSVRAIQRDIEALVSVGIIEVFGEPDEQRQFRVLFETDPRFPVQDVGEWEPKKNGRPHFDENEAEKPHDTFGKPHDTFGKPHDKSVIHKQGILKQTQHTGGTTSSATGELDVSEIESKSTKTSKNSPSAHKPSKDTKVEFAFGSQEEDADTIQAKRMASKLAKILAANKRQGLNTKPEKWFKDFLKAKRNNPHTTLDEIEAAIDNLGTMFKSIEHRFIPTFHAPEGFFENYVKIQAGFARMNAPQSGKNSPQIDEKVKARAEAAYAEYERVNGHLPNWPKTITRESVIIMLAESMSRWKDFRNNSAEWAGAHREVFDSYAKKPTPGTAAYSRYEFSRWVIEKHTTIALFDDSMADFAQRWLGILNQAVKTFTASNAKAYTWKPDYVFFVKYVTKSYATVSANDWQRIIEAPPPHDA